MNEREKKRRFSEMVLVKSFRWEVALEKIDKTILMSLRHDMAKNKVCLLVKFIDYLCRCICIYKCIYRYIFICIHREIIIVEIRFIIMNKIDWKDNTHIYLYIYWLRHKTILQKSQQTRQKKNLLIAWNKLSVT